MLSLLEVHGFQSVHGASVPLGRLTVVTGPSNVGKSSLMRALEGLAENLRGTDAISTGKSTCTIAVVAEDEGWAVRLTRTRSHKGDEYRIAPSGEVYTKLAGQVPEDVSALLRLSPLNVSAQADPPFLLTRTGREVAGVLGDLTNVSMVLRAAAEAGRVRKGLARDLKAAEARLAGLTEQAQGFAGLGDKLDAISIAEEALTQLADRAARMTRLRGLLSQLEASRGAVARLAEATARSEPPSLARLEAITERLDRLRALANEQEHQGLSAWSADQDEAAARARESDLHAELHQVLADAGTCPTCGQGVTA